MLKEVKSLPKIEFLHVLTFEIERVKHFIDYHETVILLSQKRQPIIERSVKLHKRRLVYMQRLLSLYPESVYSDYQDFAANYFKK